MSTITMPAPVGNRRTADETRPQMSSRPQAAARPQAGGRPQISTPVRPARPGQGSGRRSGPTGRSRSGVAAPQLRRPTDQRPLGCVGEPASAPLRRARPVSTRTRLQLTNRGIALVLVAGAMVVVAALTVVGATALRVTSDSYQPAFSSAAR